MQCTKALPGSRERTHVRDQTRIPKATQQIAFVQQSHKTSIKCRAPLMIRLIRKGFVYTKIMYKFVVFLSI